MPNSISLSNLRFALPDGTPLFTDLNFSFGAERTGLVGRNGSGKSTLLRIISGDQTASAGRVSATGSIGIMRQQAMTHPTDTIADLFGVRPALEVLERADRGLIEAEELAVADWTLPARIEAALHRCGLSADTEVPLASLSGGQQTRAALAALVFAEPDFILLDEPTNNLDREGRRAVIGLIREWRGGAIIASHDRELLEAVDAIVELTSLGAARYGGNYSAFRARKAAELEAAAWEVSSAEQASAEIARRARQASERKARKDGAGQRARARNDQPKIMMDYAKARAEASGGANARLREARREAADEALTSAREKIEVIEPIRMDVPSTDLPAGRTVLRLERVTGGYDPAAPVIRDFSLTLTGPERVVISGPNGSGKTTLLALMTTQLAPFSGNVDVAVPFALLDQHVRLLDPAVTLRDNFLRLNAAATSHDAHAALARFGFRADDGLRPSGKLSGGERLRAGLACVLGASPVPQLLILDEPTNHLDLDGIAALEAALASYDGAILAVSHDQSFIDALSPDREIQLGA